jgi:cytochrome c oxidase cbb3-type subunit 2
MSWIGNRYVFTVVAAAAATAGILGVSGSRVEGQERGKAAYEKHCVECHGSAGKGDGPAAMFLTPRPRDFTTGKYKIRTTETGTPPTDEDLTGSVRRGLHGTAMPAWDRILSDADVADVVQYIKSLSTQFAAPPKPVVVGAGPVSSPVIVARGQQAYDKLQCGKCHGTDGRGTGAVATSFEDDARQPLPAADLTEPWTFRGGATARDIYLRFRTGMMGTPMPSFADAASDAEMWDLATYVVSLGRKPVWSMTADEIVQLYARQDAEAKRNPVKHGKYLVDTHLCSVCHSPLDEQGRMLPGMYMAGGQVVRVMPWGEFPAANLTSDKDTGVGTFSDEQLKQAITRGVMHDGSRMLPFPMDWSGFSAMTPDDLNAMIAYLRTIPPVKNRVPPPSRSWLPVHLWGKFQMLILHKDPPIVIFSGNAGSAGGR